MIDNLCNGRSIVVAYYRFDPRRDLNYTETYCGTVASVSDKTIEYKLNQSGKRMRCPCSGAYLDNGTVFVQKIEVQT